VSAKRLTIIGVISMQVGYLDGGVAALRWSPDGETLCLVTSRGQMLLMTKVSPEASNVNMVLLS